ncbi:MAG: dephospho-CoA kinase [Hydrogenophaga sp.]|jgi:dephospho-CoA kinase|uniref:dephospho-CoA kinase n=1 Tax=Hydrogenophaga sp. TaxID=1904254 RepID=UPI00260D90FB|nr:dephospho-CoA kinase [Hydrogenophaga sp.]MCW5669774.1 dephospho-CoA kinase [Hydrogenophaga sp.]
MLHTPPLRLGLTGGIGSGKSTLARLLQVRGAEVIDADAISRRSTQAGGSAMPAIAQTFGQAFLTPDGALDRQRMRDHVFAHPEARHMLEHIIHPLVGADILRQAQASTSRCLVFDVPLLVESARWRPQLDRVLVVDCSQATQIRRVHARSGWDAATTEAVMRNQSPRALRLAAADLVVYNDSDDLPLLERTAEALARRFGL